MRHYWLTALLIAVIALAGRAASAQGLTRFIPIVFHGTTNVATVYPCEAAPYPASQGIADLRTFSGGCAPSPLGPGAMPGILSLCRKKLALDVGMFATIPTGQTGPCVVQSYRLAKEVPGSQKCPDVYGMSPGRYFQFDSGVRTWWSLNFTQPGTLFTLEVLTACRDTTTDGSIGRVRLHFDQWLWRVVANVDTLDAEIDLFHGGAVSTLEVPCIIGEDMYDALKKAAARLRTASEGSNATEFGNAIFDMEALVIANCLFAEVLNPAVLFPGPDQFGAPAIQPPGNLAPTVQTAESGAAVAGIIDTIEHPCCCKIIVDLEYITTGRRRGEDVPDVGVGA